MAAPSKLLPGLKSLRPKSSISWTSSARALKKLKSKGNRKQNPRPKKSPQNPKPLESPGVVKAEPASLATVLIRRATHGQCHRNRNGPSVLSEEMIVFQ